MLKLIIADDESVIRETIAKLIDWNCLGIQVVSICKNGIEAYDAVLDENPDIVLTDIKMPGMTGLQLIQQIKHINQYIEFIILSGYGEFGFAAEAMQYGIKHYLLKPCDEKQITHVMKLVVQECYQKRALQNAQEKQKFLTNTLKENIFCNMIAECLSEEFDFEVSVKDYEHFIDFNTTAYELCYLYFLEEKHLSSCIDIIDSYNQKYLQTNIYCVYVKNSLVLFFERFLENYEELDAFIQDMSLSDHESKILYKRVTYENLYDLLKQLLNRIKGYSMIYFLKGNHIVPICNYDAMFKKAEECSHILMSKSEQERSQKLPELKNILTSFNNIEFLKALIASLLLKHTNSTYDTMAEFLLDIKRMNEPGKICDRFFSEIQMRYHEKNLTVPKYKDFIEKALIYIDEHLSDPKLSLKEIAEQYLFMNVDYVGKQFLKQTGYKFSTYVNQKRVQKAKLLLLEGGEDKMYAIAEQIGCGNNPQYFSQLFKKYVGLTPTAFIKNMSTKQ